MFDEWVHRTSMTGNETNIDWSPLNQKISTQFGSFHVDFAGGEPYAALGSYCGTQFSFHGDTEGSFLIALSENYDYEYFHPYVVSSHVDFVAMILHILPRLRPTKRNKNVQNLWKAFQNANLNANLPDIDTDFARDGHSLKYLTEREQT